MEFTLEQVALLNEYVKSEVARGVMLRKTEVANIRQHAVLGSEMWDSATKLLEMIEVRILADIENVLEITLEDSDDKMQILIAVQDLSDKHKRDTIDRHMMNVLKDYEREL